MVTDAQLNRLWSSLTRRATGKRARPELRPQFTRADLRSWLEAKALGGAAAWRCEYGAPGCSGGKFALGISEVSLDHRTPVSKECGGLTTLDNLAIACRHCNGIKGSLEPGFFRSLVELIRPWPKHQQSAVLTRLKQPPRAWARATAAAKGTE